MKINEKTREYRQTQHFAGSIQTAQIDGLYVDSYRVLFFCVADNIMIDRRYLLRDYLIYLEGIVMSAQRRVKNSHILSIRKKVQYNKNIFIY